MKIRCARLLAAGSLALATGLTPLALAIELQEGKWGVTTTTVSPMSPRPVEEYRENCIEEPTFDPVSEMMDQQMSSMCEITVNTDSATSLDADLSCNMQGAGTMTGKLAFTVEGNSASGQIDLRMSMNGQSIAMTNSWHADYLGACD